MVSQDYLKQLFTYKDGDLLWRGHRKGAKWNAVAGTVNSNGYRRVSVDYKLYYVHQLIYFFHHGYIPKKIDHIDGDRLNNKIENLREVTDSENMQNARKRTDNSTGFKGVSLTRNKRFRAYITVNKKQKWLGVYDSPEEAYGKYCIASKQFFGEFARS